jgi:hypothetical protein
VDHPRRLRHRRGHLFPDLQGDHPLRQPGPRAGIATAPVTVVADPATCHFQVDPTGTKKFPASCDIATRMLTNASVNYTTVAAPAGSVAQIKVGDKVIQSFNAAMTPGQPELRQGQQGTRDRAEEGSRRHPEGRRLS